ncbi:MAG: S8 family peptidase [Candidatus Yanofskybacteria bacterium]|nr:S8 family peptidase [Candidatus Yanofskybacteria bacterium]
MKTIKIQWFLVVLMFFSSTGYVNAVKITDSEARYFIKSNANIWKNSLGVRHSFDNGFTADLTDWQLRLVKIFKLEIEPVNKFYVLPAEAVNSQISSTTAARRPENRVVPDSQVPWGVKMIYNTEIASSSGGEEVLVGVLDTGVLKTHPDLERRISGCKDFTAPKVSVANGKCEDKNGHGTHVSGIIAADGGADKKGIWGVAPAAKLLAFKVCGNNGSCWADDIAVAMRTAVDDGAKVINLSLGGDSEGQLIKDAINYATDKGVVIVAAAGNDGPYAGSIDYPAANPKVIAVGAVDINMDVPDWSSRGVNEDTQEGIIEEKDLEFGAPGVNVESTWGDGEYAVISGTSMAAPHISGLVAKLWDAEGKNPAQTVRDALKEIIFDVLPEHEDNDSGYGFPQLEITQLIQ